MAHQLDFTATGEARMVSLNVNPWHNLGKVVTKEMTDQELIELAGMNWSVNSSPVFASDGKAIEGYKLLSRSEDQAHYAIVGDRYRVFQNTELVALMREIAGNTPLVWETAGVLHHGKTVWAMARIPELKISVGKGDDIIPYMLLTNGHGNKRPLEIVPTAVRVVCANTIGMALGDKSKQGARSANADGRVFDTAALAEGYAIKHTAGLDAALKDVVEAYKSFREGVATTQQVFDAMLNVPMNISATQSYWDDVFGQIPDEEQLTAVDAYRERQNELRRIYTSPTCTMGGMSGTLYAAYQAATEFVDHGRVGRKRVATTEAGLASIAMGAGAKLKKEAFEKALEYAA